MGIMSSAVSQSQKEKDLQAKVTSYETLLNRIRYEVTEIDGVPSPYYGVAYITGVSVVSAWLDAVQKKKAEDAEKAKIVQIVNEELDKRKAADA